MADLEKLLLEAAGRTITPGRKRHSSPPSRRRRKGSYSDDGSDSKNDDSDADDGGYPSRKPSGSQVPLKKRLEPANRGGQEGDDADDYVRDRDSEDDSVGSYLYTDEDDREKLSKLTELEREMILADRASRRSDRDLTEKLKRRKGHDRKGSPPKMPTRSSMRSKAERAGALDELVKRRRKSAKGGYGSGYSPVKRRSFTAATLSSPSRSESGTHSDDEGDSAGDGGLVDSDDGDKASLPTFEDIKEITIGRSKLAKWFMEPFFDELIVGCFVRIGIGKSRSGPIYRLCVVRNVDAADPDRQYKLDNKITHKYLNVVWGNESSAARWQMSVVSDSPPLMEEFDQWVREVERSGGYMPTKQDVLDKKSAIQKTKSFVYSAATVKQMLQDKKSVTRRPLNVAAEKDRLRRALDVAKDNDDEAEIERITARLQELEATRLVQDKNSKAMKLAEMNRKNRADNFKNASELKPIITGLKAGDDGYDPFSRRWTRSRNYYVANSNAEETGSGGGASGSDNGAVEGVAATAAALEAAADAGKLVDTRAPVDGGTESYLVHNFELPISLSVIQKFGGPGAGYMARKQMIEGRYGVKVGDDDGKMHAHTLTISDYKRRRGLL